MPNEPKTVALDDLLTEGKRPLDVVECSVDNKSTGSVHHRMLDTYVNTVHTTQILNILLVVRWLAG